MDEEEGVEVTRKGPLEKALLAGQPESDPEPKGDADVVGN